MNIRVRITDAAGFFFINRVHVFFMPVLLTYFWNQVMRLALPFEYYLMIALTTAGGYIYNMHTDGAEDSVNYSNKYRIFLPDAALTKYVIYGCFFAGFLLSLPAGIWFVLYGGVVHFLGSLYSRPLPIKWNGRTLRVKEVPFFKNIYAGLFWSVALIFTPYFYVGEVPGSEVAIVIAICFGLNYCVELMWDIRDIPGDRRAGFRTVPIVVGETAACWIWRIVHGLTCGLILWGVFVGYFPRGFLIALIHLILGMVFFERFRRLENKDWASHIYILYAGALLIVGMIWNSLATNGA